MAGPNSTFTELSAITYKKYLKRKVWDNMSNHTALLNRIAKKGNIKTLSGGTTIQVPLDYAENATYQRYSGYDTLNVAASQIISAAEFNWKQVAIHVTASGREIRINSGPEAMANLVSARLKNAMRTAYNNFSSDMYSDGTTTNQIGGLQTLVDDAGTDTVGGIDSSTQTFWANKVQDANAPLQGGAGITPSNTSGVMESLFLPLWLALTRNNDKPDLILLDDTYFEFYENGLVGIKRYTQSEQAQGGFISLKYKTADVVYDSSDAGMPDQHGYFLNTDYIGIRSHPDANWTEVPEKTSINQDAVVMPIIWMGNMWVSNRALQGVLLDNS